MRLENKVAIVTGASSGIGLAIVKKFKAEEPNTIEYKIGEIFSELKNKISSGYKRRNLDLLHLRDQNVL